MAELKRHLVVMARAPRLGTVKRRLARDIGDVAALRFYRGHTRALLRDLSRDPRWLTWLAVTPDGAARDPRGLWDFPGPVLAQGDGDLGRRMARIFRDLPPGPVVIVGSDIPGITRAGVFAAFRSLGANDWVFGPAEDGGYWLVGARRRPALRNPFQGVRWSSRHALADSLAGLQDRRVGFVERLNDVDDGADFRRL
jgi:rSAM/selenodomain-associated transferase 1